MMSCCPASILMYAIASVRAVCRVPCVIDMLERERVCIALLSKVDRGLHGGRDAPTTKQMRSSSVRGFSTVSMPHARLHRALPLWGNPAPSPPEEASPAQEGIASDSAGPRYSLAVYTLGLRRSPCYADHDLWIKSITFSFMEQMIMLPTFNR